MKKNTMFACSLLATCAFVFSSCSQKEVNADIERKVAAESQINSQSDLNAESSKLIESAKGITEAQRSQLISLRDRARLETQEQNKESLRLKAVLVQEMLSPNYNRREIAILQKKIKKAEDKKLSILMDSITQTNTILGRQANDRRDDGNYDYIMHDYNFEQRSF